MPDQATAALTAASAPVATLEAAADGEAPAGPAAGQITPAAVLDTATWP
ncbi:MAG TPA: hypothetical protein VFQ68_39930 [Streptosporangiaceae bacterium]|nr:hypothetical protein [Streptosporangiaceae bacterium]